MRNAIIAGCICQDGWYLTEFLLAKGYEVHGLKSRASSFNTERVDHIFQDLHENENRFFLHYADLTDGSSLSSLLHELEPGAICNIGDQSHAKVSCEIRGLSERRATSYRNRIDDEPEQVRTWAEGWL